MSSGLDTRSGATTLGLDDLVDYAWRGHIRVPHFQRDFKWSTRDVIRLFDSIFRGYPVGSLLLWRRPAPRQKITLGALEFEAPAVSDALWVVDGQQRLVSLANALHPDGNRDKRFALGYDLRGDHVVELPVSEDPHVVPLSVVFDLAKVLGWFAENPELSKYQGKAFGLAKQLREFSIPAYQVVQENIPVLQDIFDRMNNYGKRLSRAEIFTALNAGPEAEASERLTISRIAEHVDDQHNFGRIDDDTVLRAILARRGPDIQREIRLEFDEENRRGVLEFPNEDEDKAFAAGEEAMSRAVQFLVEIGVPHFTLLAYKYLLIVLTRIFGHYPNPDAVNRKLLRRWYWRAAVLGPEIFKGSATGAARALCVRVHPGDLTGSVRELLVALERSQPSLPEIRRFRTNEAATKIFLCSLWALSPRSIETGLPYRQIELAEALLDRPTAADAVRNIVRQNSVPPKYRLWAANKVLMPVLSQATTFVGPALLEDTNSQDRVKVLKSHVISGDTANLIANGDIESLLQARQTELVKHFDSFLKRRCEWSFEDTPPLADLLIEDLAEDED